MIERKNETNKRQVKVLSRATYRRVIIMTTETGFSFIFGNRQYNCQSLREATALIDAIYARLDSVLSH